jgi:hypothetical protein
MLSRLHADASQLPSALNLPICCALNLTICIPQSCALLGIHLLNRSGGLRSCTHLSLCVLDSDFVFCNVWNIILYCFPAFYFFLLLELLLLLQLRDFLCPRFCAHRLDLVARTCFDGIDALKMHEMHAQDIRLFPPIMPGPEAHGLLVCSRRRPQCLRFQAQIRDVRSSALTSYRYYARLWKYCFKSSTWAQTAN